MIWSFLYFSEAIFFCGGGVKFATAVALIRFQYYVVHAFRSLGQYFLLESNFKAMDHHHQQPVET